MSSSPSTAVVVLRIYTATFAPAPTALRRTAHEVALQGRHIGGLEEPRSPGGCRGHRVLAD
jgi:hypothetical protein